MNDLFYFAAHNTCVALVLALFVYCVDRVARKPPVAHLLWLLVLLKLVSPPVVGIDWFTTGLSATAPPRSARTANQRPITGHPPENHTRALERPPGIANIAGSATTMTENHSMATWPRLWRQTRPILIWLWLGGAAACTVVAAMRILRFERLLRGAHPATAEVRQLTKELATQLGARVVPDVRHLWSVAVPFVWCSGHRPTIILPMRLLGRIEDHTLALILTHELAHLRRRDHWVRAVELVISIIHWWNPLAWLIRRQIHRAEDLCCDAWVRLEFPDRAHLYAELLFETARSLRESTVGSPRALASPFLRSSSLKARIVMILESRFAPRVSRRSIFLIALAACVVLPTFVRPGSSQARAVSGDDPPAAALPKPAAQASSEFPYKVRFEQGATRFQDGDKITIEEVRGTADTFETGNIYCIKGTYTLASHQRATLAAYTTARDAANGRNSPLKVQMTTVNRGDGTFTLFLPMTCAGWPHVSFYPSDGGADFGGNYFGTGDSVLKLWWRSKE